MNKLLHSYVLVCLLAPVNLKPSQAQTMTHARTTTQKSSTAGKHANTRRTVEPTPKYCYDANPFDGNQVKVPVNFCGVDVKAIVDAMAKAPQLVGKTEFETTATYEARRASFASAPLLGNLKAGDVMAFVLHAGKEYGSLLQVQYDADKERFNLTLDMRSHSGESDFSKETPAMDRMQDVVAADLREDEVGTDKYIGGNAMGARVEVTRYASKIYGVAVGRGNSIYKAASSYAEQNKPEIYLDVSPSSASSLKDQLAVILTGTLSEPWAVTSAIYREPTISDPFEMSQLQHYLTIIPKEILVFRMDTGEILLRDAVTATTTETAEGVKANRTPGPIRVSGGVMAANLVKRVDPVYPPIARSARLSGTVVLAAKISATGEIEELHVVSGPAMLLPSAIDAVKQWHYAPYTLGGSAVEVNTTITVNFNLSAAP